MELPAFTSKLIEIVNVNKFLQVQISN